MSNDEAKQRAKNYMSLKGALDPKQIKCYCGHTTMCDCSPKEEPKQETLEEAAINFYREFPSNPLDKPEWHYNRDVDCFKKRKAFINGAKYMAERMYSEEEVKEIIKLSCEEGMFIQRTINDKVNIPYTRIKDFTIKMFEQFKKK